MFIFTCFTGSILLIAYRALGSSEKKVESSKANCDEIPENTSKIVRISCAAEKMTFERLNNPKHPQYIDITLKNGNGNQYNL
jgi:hypothetical protein